jgi:EmrB/QacA subfamily drug resistance transporter
LPSVSASESVVAEEDAARTAGSADADLRQAWRVLAIVCLASLMSGLSSSALNISLPTIVRSLHATSAEASWILLASMLTNTVLLLVFGRLADAVGRRQMYLAGIAIFTAGSLGAGFAPTVWMLIGCLVVQAIAGAMLITNSASLVTMSFPGRLLGVGFGLYLASFSVAQLLGPSVGGLIAAHLGWRWDFWVNVPLGAVAWVGAFLVLRRTPRSSERVHLDPVGNLLVLVGLGSLLLALSEVGTLGWTSPWILAGVGVFVVATAAFLYVEQRSTHPVVDLASFREPLIGYGVLAGFLGTMSRFAVVLLVGLYFQAARGDSAGAAGLKVLPLSAAAIVGSSGAGLLLRRYRAHAVAIGSTAVTMLGLVMLLLVLSPTTPYWLMVVATVAVGLGSGSFIPSNSTGMLEALPLDRVGITNAVRIMSQNAGIVITTALSLTIISTPLAGSMRQDIFDGTLADVGSSAVTGLITGYRWALALMLVTSVLCVWATLAGRRAASPASRHVVPVPCVSGNEVRQEEMST